MGEPASFPGWGLWDFARTGIITKGSGLRLSGQFSTTFLKGILLPLAMRKFPCSFPACPGPWEDTLPSCIWTSLCISFRPHHHHAHPCFTEGRGPFAPEQQVQDRIQALSSSGRGSLRHLNCPPFPSGTALCYSRRQTHVEGMMEQGNHHPWVKVC